MRKNHKGKKKDKRGNTNNRQNEILNESNEWQEMRKSNEKIKRKT
jgi:hypothetical protein